MTITITNEFCERIMQVLRDARGFFQCNCAGCCDGTCVWASAAQVAAELNRAASVPRVGAQSRIRSRKRKGPTI